MDSSQLPGSSLASYMWPFTSLTNSDMSPILPSLSSPPTIPLTREAFLSSPHLLNSTGLLPYWSVPGVSPSAGYCASPCSLYGLPHLAFLPTGRGVHPLYGGPEGCLSKSPEGGEVKGQTS